MPFIKTIEPEEADGLLKKIYEELIDKRGKLARIHKIQSLHPETIATHMELYMSVMFSKSPLSRPQREMIAVVVSAANGCEYCWLHHGEALYHYWKDKDRIEQLRKDFSRLDLSEVDTGLCNLAQQLTLRPEQTDEEIYIKALRNLGLSDRAILDAVLVIGYFNFVNRIVMGLGVETDEKETKGYRY